MPLSRIYSAQKHLLSSEIIRVETDVTTNSLYSFSMVGLATKAVDEARDRVSSAIKNSGFKSPKQTNAKIVVSLAPANIKKEGALFDLPIAIGYLTATGALTMDTDSCMFVGELALDGSIQPVSGALSYARTAQNTGIKELYLPVANALEAALITGVTVYGVTDLTQLIHHLKHIKPIHPTKIPDRDTLIQTPATRRDSFDLIHGNHIPKRGLMLAGAGGHNIALYGPAGTGKTMLPKAFKDILPPLSFEEIIELTELYSNSGFLTQTHITERPMRSPHHTASYSSIIGGGSTLRPGEITLAHRGVLFLDEFPEFNQQVLESLRQPLEDRKISLTRTLDRVEFPAQFILVAALNPCPCGNHGNVETSCTCTTFHKTKYRKKLSGPIMDRIDIWIEVLRNKKLSLPTNNVTTQETDMAREIVIRTREIQKRRYGSTTTLNSTASQRELMEHAHMTEQAHTRLLALSSLYTLSNRGYYRTIRLARTIADIEQSHFIQEKHILEAVQYRPKNTKE